VRFRSLVVAAAIAGMAGCGYVGPVLPPSPEIPQAIANLTAVERGDQLEINFSTPPRTTDNLAIKKFSNVELAVGPDVHPFDFERWSASARQYEMTPPPENDPDEPQPQPMFKRIPASEWMGKQVAVAVRTSVKKNDHFSSWSNRVVLEVIPSLAPPEMQKPEPTAKGVLLKWTSEGEGVEYRILRQGPGEESPAQIGTSTTPDYVDASAQYDTPYRYSAVAFKGLAESLPSEPKEITPRDIFPPSVPASITALAGPDSVEVSWQRSPESDLKGYYLYRSVDGSPFTRLGGALAVPTYSDHDVQHGKAYRYEVSAFNQKGYESAKSSSAEVVF
jgi:predicted small lipoprotein YifL